MKTSSLVDVRPPASAGRAVERGRTGLQPGFSVLLGPDLAGKSSVIALLSSAGWRCVSYDRGLVDPEYPLVDELRESFVAHALGRLGAPYSTDFVLTLLQTSVVYLRDQVTRVAADRPVIVDSYYYKILAKCVLRGMVNEEMFAWWRSFPRPRQVVFLDVSPETAWRRSGQGALLNWFEYYGDRPTPEGFRRFQTDLRRLMVDEVGDVPLTFLGEFDGVSQAADAIQRVTGRNDATRAGG